VTYFERKPERERPVRMGSGQVSHYALAVPADSLAAVANSLSAQHLPVTPIGQFGSDQLQYDGLVTRDPAGQPVIIAVPR
jgi:hypothetical protein